MRIIFLIVFIAMVGQGLSQSSIQQVTPLQDQDGLYMQLDIMLPAGSSVDILRSYDPDPKKATVLKNGHKSQRYNDHGRVPMGKKVIYYWLRQNGKLLPIQPFAIVAIGDQAHVQPQPNEPSIHGAKPKNETGASNHTGAMATAKPKGVPAVPNRADAMAAICKFDYKPIRYRIQIASSSAGSAERTPANKKPYFFDEATGFNPKYLRKDTILDIGLCENSYDYPVDETDYYAIQIGETGFFSGPTKCWENKIELPVRTPELKFTITNTSKIKYEEVQLYAWYSNEPPRLEISENELLRLKPLIDQSANQNLYWKYKLGSIAPNGFLRQEIRLPSCKGINYRYLKYMPIIHGILLKDELMIIDVASGKKIR
jgi:hypothetical protein